MSRVAVAFRVAAPHFADVALAVMPYDGAITGAGRLGARSVGQVEAGRSLGVFAAADLPLGIAFIEQCLRACSRSAVAPSLAAPLPLRPSRGAHG